MGYKCMQPNRAIENAFRLIRDLYKESGVDLVVFIKRSRTMDPTEVEYCRLFEEFLCEGQVLVAIVVAGLKMHGPMEGWWETNGQEILKTFGGNMIGHACITASCGYKEVYSKKVLESRLSVQAMLEDCVSSHSPLAKVDRIPAKLPLKRAGEMGGPPKKMTVKNLRDFRVCGLTKKQAEELIMLYYGSE